MRIGVVLFAWLAASGSLWDAVQVFAWGRMYVLNLQASSSLTEAMAETFSGEAMCGLCKTVQAAKENPREDSPGLVEAAGKAPLLPIGEPGKLIIPPAFGLESLVLVKCRASGREAEPAVPPPRLG